jgi:hypothetical protein
MLIQAADDITEDHRNLEEGGDNDDSSEAPCVEC